MAALNSKLGKPTPKCTALISRFHLLDFRPKKSQCMRKTTKSMRQINGIASSKSNKYNLSDDYKQLRLH